MVAAVLAGAFALSAAGQDRGTQREAIPRRLRCCFAHAARRMEEARDGLDDYPLYPYLEGLRLRRAIGESIARRCRAFPRALAGHAAESDVRDAYLRELARRGEWTTFRTFWKTSRDRDLQCDALARASTAGEKLDFATDIEPLWSNPRTLPGACDRRARLARSIGTLIDARVWARLLDAPRLGNTKTAPPQPPPC